jgi:phosphotransferase system  glucose/maltose/N-acetylglucosamine-specific IIC component
MFVSSEEIDEIAKENFWHISKQFLTVIFQKTCVLLCILVAVLYSEALTPQYVFALLIIYEALPAHN